MTPKVSVVVPVYNAKDNIARCCQALFSQTLDNLEIIFVDDCSSDNSIEIIYRTLLQYPEMSYNTIILKHERNSGVGAARRTGNSHAKGEYVIHCDSDDYPCPDMYESLFLTAKQTDADIVICDYKCGDEIVSLKADNTSVPSFDISPIEGAVWNKLIRRQLLEDNSIFFSPDLILGEDFLYVTQCRLKARRTVHLPRPLYNHTIDNNESITRHFDQRKCNSIVNVAKMMEEFINRNNLTSQYSFKLNYLKFQAKSFYLQFPETRDLRRYASLFPECETFVFQFPIHPYRKLCSKLIKMHLAWVVNLLLTIKDKI